jgi:hypothetical protein
MRATPSWLSETPSGAQIVPDASQRPPLSLQGDHFSDGCLLSLNRHQHSVVGPPSLAGFVFLKVAIVAIMRKLLILANALIRDQRKWAPANP